MKTVLFSCLVFFSTLCYAQNESEPQAFVPELTSRFLTVRDLALSAKGDELYFTVQSLQDELSVLVTAQKIEGHWTLPTLLPFSGQYHDLEPFLSTDGLRLYFVSNRPLLASDQETKDFDIWYVDRPDPGSSWSEPKNLGAPVNTEHNEFYPSVSDKQTIYFTSDAENATRKDDLLSAQWNGNAYDPPVSVGDSINTPGYEFNSFIAPDESYLIFSGYNRSDGLGSGDLYIAYKMENGEWSKAQNLGPEINSDKMDFCPLVNGNYLYFTSKRSAVNQDKKAYKNLEEVLSEMNRPDNGLSRLYRIPFKK
jgi:hypothetical protein